MPELGFHGMIAQRPECSLMFTRPGLAWTGNLPSMMSVPATAYCSFQAPEIG